MHEIRFSEVEFSYETMSAPLLRDLTLHFPLGWTGIVGANGSGKTTLLKLAVGAYRPVAGSVLGPEESVYCAQRTDRPPPLLGPLLEAMDGEAWKVKGRLGLEADWLERWESLSHGERKRAQIAVALWLKPRVLAVDEPTNHIDAPARRLLGGALRDFGGVGLLVSHDRELLDRLCRQCVFVDPPGATVRPGGYSQGIQQEAMEEGSLRREAEQARRQRDRLEREVVRRRAAAARSDKRRSKRGLGKDNSERYKRNLARVSGRDGQSGRLLRQMDGRLEQARQKAEEIRQKKTYDLGIWLGEERSKRDVLLRLAAGVIDLGGGRTLNHPDLVMRPHDRVALCGPNGGGKSTLVRHLLRRLNIEAARLVYLPQEISAGQARRILAEARSLPRAEVGPHDDGGEPAGLQTAQIARERRAESRRSPQDPAGAGDRPGAAPDRHGRADQPSRPAFDRMPGGGAGRVSLWAAARQPRRALFGAVDGYPLADRQRRLRPEAGSSRRLSLANWGDTF